MRVPGRLYCRLQPGSSGFEGRTQRANQAKPTQKVKAPTAGTEPLVAKGMSKTSKFDAKCSE